MSHYHIQAYNCIFNCKIHCILFILIAIQYLHIVERGNYMAFQIRPNKKESENKTIRFPLELINQINQAIEGKDVSFSNFVIQACKYALDNMETDAK